MIVYLNKREVCIRTGLTIKKLDEQILSGRFPRSLPTNSEFWSAFEIETIETARCQNASHQEIQTLVRALEQARHHTS